MAEPSISVWRDISAPAGRIFSVLARPAAQPKFQSGVGEPARHQWGWQLEPLDAGRTRVTEFFDCSRSPDWLQNAVKGGERWRPEIEASLENLERLVAES